MRDPLDQTIDAVLKTSPPAVISFYSMILKMPIEKWVAVLTIIYIALQIFLLIRDRIVRNRRETDNLP